MSSTDNKQQQPDRGRLEQLTLKVLNSFIDVSKKSAVTKGDDPAQLLSEFYQRKGVPNEAVKAAFVYDELKEILPPVKNRKKTRLGPAFYRCTLTCPTEADSTAVARSSLPTCLLLQILEKQEEKKSAPAAFVDSTERQLQLEDPTIAGVEASTMASHEAKRPSVVQQLDDDVNSSILNWAVSQLFGNFRLFDGHVYLQNKKAAKRSCALVRLLQIEQQEGKHRNEEDRTLTFSETLQQAAAIAKEWKPATTGLSSSPTPPTSASSSATSSSNPCSATPTNRKESLGHNNNGRRTSRDHSNRGWETPRRTSLDHSTRSNTGRRGSLDHTVRRSSLDNLNPSPPTGPRTNYPEWVNQLLDLGVDTAVDIKYHEYIPPTAVSDDANNSSTVVQDWDCRNSPIRLSCTLSITKPLEATVTTVRPYTSKTLALESAVVLLEKEVERRRNLNWRHRVRSTPVPAEAGLRILESHQESASIVHYATALPSWAAANFSVGPAPKTVSPVRAPSSRTLTRKGSGSVQHDRSSSSRTLRRTGSLKEYEESLTTKDCDDEQQRSFSYRNMPRTGSLRAYEESLMAKKEQRSSGMSSSDEEDRPVSRRGSARSGQEGSKRSALTRKGSSPEINQGSTTTTSRNPPGVVGYLYEVIVVDAAKAEAACDASSRDARASVGPSPFVVELMKELENMDVDGDSVNLDFTPTRVGIIFPTDVQIPSRGSDDASQVEYFTHQVELTWKQRAANEKEWRIRITLANRTVLFEKDMELAPADDAETECGSFSSSLEMLAQFNTGLFCWKEYGVGRGGVSTKFQATRTTEASGQSYVFVPLLAHDMQGSGTNHAETRDKGETVMSIDWGMIRRQLNEMFTPLVASPHFDTTVRVALPLRGAVLVELSDCLLLVFFALLGMVWHQLLLFAHREVDGQGGPIIAHVDADSAHAMLDRQRHLASGGSSSESHVTDGTAPIDSELVDGLTRLEAPTTTRLCDQVIASALMFSNHIAMSVTREDELLFGVFLLVLIGIALRLWRARRGTSYFEYNFHRNELFNRFLYHQRVLYVGSACRDSEVLEEQPNAREHTGDACLNALSAFPAPKDPDAVARNEELKKKYGLDLFNATYADYYWKRYGIKVQSPLEPLVRARFMGRQHKPFNPMTRRGKADEATLAKDCAHLIPELVRVLPVPRDFLYSVAFLQSDCMTKLELQIQTILYSGVLVERSMQQLKSSSEGALIREAVSIDDLVHAGQRYHAKLAGHGSSECLWSQAITIAPMHRYERLEFLGDAVLSHMVAINLVVRHNAKLFYDEDDLTVVICAAVKNKVLCKSAQRLGLPRVLEHVRRLYKTRHQPLSQNKKKEANGSAIADGTLSDVVESLLAALYLAMWTEDGADTDQNLIEVGTWTLKFFVDQLMLPIFPPSVASLSRSAGKPEAQLVIVSEKKKTQDLPKPERHLTSLSNCCWARGFDFTQPAFSQWRDQLFGIAAILRQHPKLSDKLNKCLSTLEDKVLLGRRLTGKAPGFLKQNRFSIIVCCTALFDNDLGAEDGDDGVDLDDPLTPFLGSASCRFDASGIESLLPIALVRDSIYFIGAYAFKLVLSEAVYRKFPNAEPGDLHLLRNLCMTDDVVAYIMLKSGLRQALFDDSPYDELEEAIEKADAKGRKNFWKTYGGWVIPGGRKAFRERMQLKTISYPEQYAFRSYDKQKAKDDDGAADENEETNARPGRNPLYPGLGGGRLIGFDHKLPEEWTNELMFSFKAIVGALVLSVGIRDMWELYVGPWFDELMLLSPPEVRYLYTNSSGLVRSSKAKCQQENGNGA